jgi:hypothetical protein
MNERVFSSRVPLGRKPKLPHHAMTMQVREAVQRETALCTACIRENQRVFGSSVPLGRKRSFPTTMEMQVGELHEHFPNASQAAGSFLHDSDNSGSTQLSHLPIPPLPRSDSIISGQ